MVEKSTQFVATTSSNFIQIDLASSDEIKKWAQRSYFIEDKVAHNGQSTPVDEPRGGPRDAPRSPALGSGEIGWTLGSSRAEPPTTKGPEMTVRSTKPPVGSQTPSHPSHTMPSGENRSGKIFEIGEVKRADTLNYRTFKPEKDGLFCEKIFGPVNDWTCSCGHLKEQKFTLDHEKILLGKLKPKLCPLCFVEASSSRLRRYRMGYISLACPVTHIWYLNSRPSLFSILLKMPTKYIKKVAYYKAYSPSSSQREYMSSCLGPGGDFFDNEWAFLHSWLSGKHLLEDFPSKLTKKINSPARHATTRASGASQVPPRAEPRAGGPKVQAPELTKNESVSPSAERHPSQTLKSKLRFRYSERIALPARDSVPPKAERRAGGTKYRPRSTMTVGPGCSADQKSDYLDSRGFIDRRSSEVNSPHIIRQLTSKIKVGFDTVSPLGVVRSCEEPTLPSAPPARGSALGGTKWRAGGSIHLANNLQDLQNIIRLDSNDLPLGASPVLRNLKKFPESPNWLVNTGAQALLNQLESRNWEKEIEKLEHESNFQTGIALADQNTSDSTRGSTGGFAAGESAITAGASQVAGPTGGSALAPSMSMIKGWTLGSSMTVGPGGSTEPHADRDNFFEKRLKNRLRILKLLKSFQKSGLQFSGMIFRTLPVLPPELRPIIQLGAGQLASSDVNDLYRRIISRNNRLKYYLYETHFVEFLVRSEQQLVQLAVDALLENGKTTSVRHTSGQKRLYKSLSDRIGGKQGRFRMNLLGKRVDYSGRSVIVVGPRLKLFQCGLPYEMGIELFQPFLLRHMLELQLAKTIRGAKTILRFNKPLARQLLHHVVKAHPILLNRAPTLHRLGIQAFQPVLVFGRAIHLHPLVCPAFNADFDGDQMAVHIPLSPQARVEARLLLLASGNWLSSSTGQPNVLPSQDMVLGFYYLTIEKYGYQKGRGNTYSSLTDVMQAYELGLLDLHSQVWIKWSGPFTSDINTGFSPPQSHKELSARRLYAPSSAEWRDDLRDTITMTKGPAPAASPGSSADNLICRHRNNLSLRFRRETDQPIELRLNRKKSITKIYSAYQWQEDPNERNQISFIRTTPGRVLMNQIFQKYL